MLARMRGLLGRKSLEPGQGMLITKTSSIHTAFMAFPIDAVFLDKELRVRAVVPEIPPFRASWKRGSRSVLELPAGEAARVGTGRGADFRGIIRRDRPDSGSMTANGESLGPRESFLPVAAVCGGDGRLSGAASPKTERPVAPAQ